MTATLTILALLFIVLNNLRDYSTGRALAQDIAVDPVLAPTAAAQTLSVALALQHCHSIVG